MTPRTSHKAGFTLIELTISVAIFVMIFVSMTQIFFLLQGTIARINAQREMVAWLSIITQTVSTDLENYAIDTNNSSASTLALQHVSDGSKVWYRILPAPTGQQGKVLSREVQPAGGQTRQSTFSSPLFYLPDLSMRVSPDRANPLKCSLLPSVTLRLHVQGNPDDHSLSNLSDSLQTTFSSNVYPLSYSKDCQASSSQP